MSHKNLKSLCDHTTAAHIRIQKDFQYIDPVVSVSQKMRASGMPVDVLTIDCLKTGKRIIVILHDHMPDSVSYQFSYKDQDPGDKFEEIPFAKFGEQTIYDWMKNYFDAK